MSPISALPSLSPPGLTGAGAVPAAGGGNLDFGRMLLEAVGRVDGMEKSAHTKLLDHLAGEGVTQVEALAAFRQADMALRLMLQVRNKLLEAFNEIKQVSI
ncbi:MAG: flagellar hook-basal body complex protein FliE [Planctomycetota bacterium]